MESPTKRPRLHLFDTPNSDRELDSARFKNDLTLKSRFEAIFQKYSRDFSSIGDEIDLVTGEIVVNNGHLQGLSNETDPDLSFQAGQSTAAYSSQSILRAMTATYELENPSADEVMQSVEMIAENAVLTDECSMIESDDDLFDVSPTPDNDDLEMWDTQPDPIERDIPSYSSDRDSLFDRRSLPRSQSRDSLFEPTHADDSLSRLEFLPQPQIEPSDPPSEDSQGNIATTNEDILAKFGPDVGREVLDLLEKRQADADAHIEEAWRIPVKISHPQVINPLSHEFVALPLESVQSPGTRKSIWNAPGKSRRKQSAGSTEQDEPESEAESDDPLQEDFSMNRRSQPGRSSDEEYQNRLPEAADDDEDGLYEAEREQKRLLNVSIDGECPYCLQQFSTKSGVMAHWDRWLLKDSRHKPANDPHDPNMIGSIRASAVRRVRPQRLVLCDFRTMVELHEGAGMNFKEIANSGSLRTRKTGLQLQGIYEKHRTVPIYDHTPQPPCRWSSDEIAILTKLCGNEMVTMATLRRKLTRKDEIDIGNRLAEIFLDRLGAADNGRSVGSRNSSDQSHHKQHDTGNSYVVKIEESEDELFND